MESLTQLVDESTLPQELPSDEAAPSTPSTAAEEPEPEQQPMERGLAFWLVFISLCTCSLLSALEFTSVSTALPTIIHELNGDDFVWVGSAFALACTAVLPTFGGLANIWGRKIPMVGTLIIFIAGSAICGAAQNMKMLIAGRTLRGGLMSLSEIIVADLVPLRERGTFLGIAAAVWAFASAIGPPIGGALAGKGQWRWLFYLNLPLGIIALAFVLLFLKFRVPKTNYKEKMAQMDWIGNFLVIASTTSCAIALTWAGVTAPWSSARVLVPLLVGVAGFGVFVFYEARFAKVPILPFDLLSNWTSVSGYLVTFVHGFLVIALVYYLPVYFQASKGASPNRSSIDLFGIAFTIAPSAIITGISVQVFNRYRPQIYLAWILVIIGLALMTTFDVGTHMGNNIGYQLIAGVGMGMLYIGSTFPILAGVAVNRAAPALALFTFARSFAYTWGITIGSTIMQNELLKRLPPDFLALLPSGVDIAYAAIPQIDGLSEPLKDQVKVAFADSLSMVWKVMAAVAGVGLLVTLPMKELHMHVVTDENWGMEKKETEKDVEVVTPSEK